MLTAQLRRSAVAESVAERAPRRPGLARSAVVADTSQLEIKGRRYEHGLYFASRGSFLANLFAYVFTAQSGGFEFHVGGDSGGRAYSFEHGA
jgi:hypothetical protein